MGLTESKVSTDIDGQKWTYHLATSFTWPHTIRFLLLLKCKKGAVYIPLQSLILSELSARLWATEITFSPAKLTNVWNTLKYKYDISRDTHDTLTNICQPVKCKSHKFRHLTYRYTFSLHSSAVNFLRYFTLKSSTVCVFTLSASNDMLPYPTRVNLHQNFCDSLKISPGWSDSSFRCPRSVNWTKGLLKNYS